MNYYFKHLEKKLVCLFVNYRDVTKNH